MTGATQTQIPRRPGRTIGRLLLAAVFGSLSIGLHAESAGLSAAEMAAQAPANSNPVAAAEVKAVVLEGIVEFGYQDEQGRYVVDLLERDKAYLGVRISTPDGRPVEGAMPDIAVTGASRLQLEQLTSGTDGVMNFGVIAGQMGMDTVTAKIGEAKVEFALNIISLRAQGFEPPPVIEGVIPWGDLMSAQLEFTDTGIAATFPESITSQAGEKVKLSGFMMPLQPDTKQKHFLLTSNPPSCFFHIPGGPAGSVEVVAPDGIEVSWQPILIEGRFEPQKFSEIGVVYRLVDAKVLQL